MYRRLYCNLCGLLHLLLVLYRYLWSTVRVLVELYYLYCILLVLRLYVPLAVWRLVLVGAHCMYRTRTVCTGIYVRLCEVETAVAVVEQLVL